MNFHLLHKWLVENAFIHTLVIKVHSSCNWVSHYWQISRYSFFHLAMAATSTQEPSSSVRKRRVTTRKNENTEDSVPSSPIKDVPVIKSPVETPKKKKSTPVSFVIHSWYSDMVMLTSEFIHSVVHDESQSDFTWTTVCQDVPVKSSTQKSLGLEVVFKYLFPLVLTALSLFTRYYEIGKSKQVTW